MAMQVQCRIHSCSEGRMICRHLLSESGLDYARIDVDADDYETAMCVACEAILLEDADWSDRLYSFAEFKLICKICYDEALGRHQLVAQGTMLPEQ